MIASRSVTFVFIVLTVGAVSQAQAPPFESQDHFPEQPSARSAAAERILRLCEPIEGREDGALRLHTLEDDALLTDDDLVGLRDLEEVREVLLAGDFSDRGLMHFRGLQQIEALSLEWIRISDDGLRAIGACPNLKRLRILCYSTHITLTDEGIARLALLRNLEHLELGNVGLTDAGMKHLAGMTKLRVLKVSSPKLTDAGMHHFGSLTELEELSLGTSDAFTGAGLAGLADLGRLTTLSLPGSVEGSQLGHLRQLKSLASLKVVPGTDIDRDGWRHIGALRQLRRLDAAWTMLDDEGLACLAGLSNLEELDLSYTAAGDRGMASLAHLVQLRKLVLSRAGIRHLPSGQMDFSSVIGDEALTHLAGLTRLEYLDLSLTDVTDEGLVHLEPLANLRTVRHSDTRVTATGIQRLQAVLPNVEFK